jgi:type III restriction enzyme
MNPAEVKNPILNSPFEEPLHYWYIQEGTEAELRDGRRDSIVFPPRNQMQEWDTSDGTLKRATDAASAYEMVLVNFLRKRVKAWRKEGYPLNPAHSPSRNVGQEANWRPSEAILVS